MSHYWIVLHVYAEHICFISTYNLSHSSCPWVVHKPCITEKYSACRADSRFESAQTWCCQFSRRFYSLSLEQLCYLPNLSVTMQVKDFPFLGFGYIRYLGLALTRCYQSVAWSFTILMVSLGSGVPMALGRGHWQTRSTLYWNTNGGQWCQLKIASLRLTLWSL